MANYLKLMEVAHRLGISERTARRYVTRGELPSVYVGNSYRVREEDLEEYLRQAEVKTGPKARAQPSEAGARVAQDADTRKQQVFDLAHELMKKQLAQDQQALNRAVESEDMQAYTMVHENEALQHLAQSSVGDLADAYLDLMRSYVQLENESAALRESARGHA